MNLRSLGLTLLLVLAAFVALPSLVSADDTEQDHRARLVAHGVISAIQETDEGTLLTIDRGAADDDPADDKVVLMNADTQVLPADASLEVGTRVKAIVQKTNASDTLVALKIIVPQVLKDRPNRPDPRPGRPALQIRACGEILSLPESGVQGEWTLSASVLGDLTFTVHERTLVTPPNAAPAEGDKACAHLQGASSGLMASKVHLIGDPDDDDDGLPTDRPVHIRGTVAGLSHDDAGNLVMVSVAVRGHDAPLTVQVTADTEIEGELADGARVVIKAQRSATGTGDELVAEKIKVLPERPDHQGHVRAHLIEGTVADVSAAGDLWLIDTEEEQVELRITDTTRIIGIDLANESPVGKEIHAVARDTGSGALVAVKIKVEN